MLRRPRLNWNCGRADVASRHKWNLVFEFQNKNVRATTALSTRQSTQLSRTSSPVKLRNYLTETGLEYFRFMFRCRVRIGRFKLPARLYDLQTKILMILYYTPNSTGRLLLVLLLYPWSLSRESTTVPMYA